AAVLEQLRVLRNLSLAQCRQARPERFGEPHAPHNQAERDAEIALDDHAGNLEARGDGEPASGVLSHRTNHSYARRIGTTISLSPATSPPRVPLRACFPWSRERRT